MTQTPEERLARLEESVNGVVRTLTRMDRKLDEMSRNDGPFISRAEFWPVKTIVYGGAAIVLASVITAAVAILIRT